MHYLCKFLYFHNLNKTIFIKFITLFVLLAFFNGNKCIQYAYQYSKMFLVCT